MEYSCTAIYVPQTNNRAECSYPDLKAVRYFQFRSIISHFLSWSISGYFTLAPWLSVIRRRHTLVGSRRLKFRRKKGEMQGVVELKVKSVWRRRMARLISLELIVLHTSQPTGHSYLGTTNYN